jgi:hypothetical protein
MKLLHEGYWNANSNAATALAQKDEEGDAIEDSYFEKLGHVEKAVQFFTNVTVSREPSLMRDTHGVLCRVTPETEKRSNLVIMHTDLLNEVDRIMGDLDTQITDAMDAQTRDECLENISVRWLACSGKFTNFYKENPEYAQELFDNFQGGMLRMTTRGMNIDIAPALAGSQLGHHAMLYGGSKTRALLRRDENGEDIKETEWIDAERADEVFLKKYTLLSDYVKLSMVDKAMRGQNPGGKDNNGRG